MKQTIVTWALVVAGCGDSLAGSEGESTGAATSASTGEGTSGGTSGDVPTGDEPSGGASETVEPTTGGPTETGGSSEGTSGTGEPAENCYQGGIFTSFAELAAERLAGFNCITGDVNIHDGTGPDLWFLSEIRSIGGDFRLSGPSGPHEIVSLKGLEKLESIGGALFFAETPELMDASALAGLVSIGGDVEFREAPKLAALKLPVLTKVGGGVRISAGLEILDMQGVSGPIGALELADTKLTTLAGLSGVTAILDGLRLDHNEELVDLTGLAALEQVEGRIEVWYHAKLASLEGLRGATTTPWLMVFGNPELTTLAALDGLAIGGATIQYNGALTALPKLHGEAMRLEINGNSSLLDLAGLEGLTVTSELVVSYNEGLLDLKGLGGLGDEMQQLHLEDNTLLQGLGGLVGPTSVDSLRIQGSPQLASLGLLKNVTSVREVLVAETKVASLIDLGKLTSAAMVWIVDNLELKSLAGLEKLPALEVLGVRDNPKLTGLAALQAGALMEVTQEFDISDNALLPSCAAKMLYDKLNAPPADFCFDNKDDACSGLGGCIDEPMP